MFNQLTAGDIVSLIKKREISACEVTNDIFKQIDRVENNVKAFLYINRENAIEQAKSIDDKIRRGRDPYSCWRCLNRKRYLGGPGNGNDLWFKDPQRFCSSL